MVIIPSCTFAGFQTQPTRPCLLCGSPQNPNPNPNHPLGFLFPMVEFEGSSSSRVLDGVPRFITTAISGTLTGFFALAGAFTGAIIGALAGRAADCGVLRGAGLGAIAGAVFSVEVLEAFRAYWCLEQSGSRGPSSMADFLEELFRGRLIDEQIAPVIPSAYNWQVSITNVNLNENLDVYGEVASRGLSGDSIKKLPCHTLDQIKAPQPTCCTICLQDIETGELARSLPLCQHTFHLTCVDKWLIRHGSCPICRQAV